MSNLTTIPPSPQSMFKKSYLGLCGSINSPSDVIYLFEFNMADLRGGGKQCLLVAVTMQH